METIIVTGSSGFIGSILVKELIKNNYKVIGIDIVPSTFIDNNYKEYNIDLTDINQYNNIIIDGKILCVCHLAAKIRVDESMVDPNLYYYNNISGLINLLNWCVHLQINNFLFASTAAVYGNTIQDFTKGYKEEEAGNPVSIYGKTKLMGEQILKDYQIHGINGYIFRFFNVCGGSELNHGKPIHLLPILINNLRENKDIKIFGDDYETDDGTCVRDYVHLLDICNAFILCIKNGFNNNFKIYNLGSSNGFSVKQIVDECISQYNADNSIKILIEKRRAGDTDILIANSDKIYNELGWKCQYDLKQMVNDTIVSFNL